MRTVKTLKAAQRLTPPGGLILGITNKNGESLFVIHTALDDTISVFRGGTEMSSDNTIQLIQLDDLVNPSGL